MTASMECLRLPWKEIPLKDIMAIPSSLHWPTAQQKIAVHPTRRHQNSKLCAKQEDGKKFSNTYISDIAANKIKK